MSNREFVITFIKDATGTDVTEMSVVFDDLQIDGLDTDSFMQQFAVDFNVDMRQFNLDDYSFSEYEIGNVFLTFYRGIFNRAKLKKRSFTVAHLIEVANRKRWFDPASNDPPIIREVEDIEWFKNMISPALTGYELSYKSFEGRGDFGFLSRVEFNSKILTGCADFWSSGWLNVDVWHYGREEAVVNVMLAPDEEKERDELLRKLLDMLVNNAI